MLVGDPESFAAGGQDLHRRRCREDCFDQIGGGIPDVLGVIDHQQPQPALQRGGHGLAHGLTRLLRDAQRSRDRIGHCQRIGHCRQLENPDPVGKLVGQPGRDLQRQAGLADPAHSGQGD